MINVNRRIEYEIIMNKSASCIMRHIILIIQATHVTHSVEYRTDRNSKFTLGWIDRQPDYCTWHQMADDSNATRDYLPGKWSDGKTCYNYRSWNISVKFKTASLKKGLVCMSLGYVRPCLSNKVHVDRVIYWPIINICSIDQNKYVTPINLFVISYWSSKYYRSG